MIDKDTYADLWIMQVRGAMAHALAEYCVGTDITPVQTNSLLNMLKKDDLTSREIGEFCHEINVQPILTMSDRVTEYG